MGGAFLEFAWILKIFQVNFKPRCFSDNNKHDIKSPFFIIFHKYINGPWRKNEQNLFFSLPPASAVELIELVQCFRVSIIVSVSKIVSALRAEPFDIRTQNMVQGLTLIKSRPCLMSKVISQRSRSPFQKCDFPGFSNLNDMIQNSYL